MATLVVGGIAAVAAFGYYIYRGRARKDPLQGGLIGEDQAGGPNGEGDPQDGVADANRRTGRAKIGLVLCMHSTLVRSEQSRNFPFKTFVVKIFLRRGG